MGEKKEPKGNERCLECNKPFLIQWDDDPVIVFCKYKGKCLDNDCYCYFKKGIVKPKIKKLTHYR